jgi:long-chain acyl-CoA synthetase
MVDQLIAFLACSDTFAVPLLLPNDFKTNIHGDMFSLNNIEIPEKACMAVMTSGTSGSNKLLYRTFESWYDYFPVQNEIFNMNGETRFFMQGSLAFTGNLNLCLAELSKGGTVVACDTFDPRLWLHMIEENQVDIIYLIPAKLRVLKRIYEKKSITNTNVSMIISGSQSFGGDEVKELKKLFSSAEMILYYGASELSYVTYVKSYDMCEDKTRIGKPFPKVNVRVDEGKLLVTTQYAVIGIIGETFIGDYGHTDEEGFFYFDGRYDDICNVNGRKISAIRVENAILSLPEVSEAAVKVVNKNGREYLAAFIVPASEHLQNLTKLRSGLEPLLEKYEQPHIIKIVDILPKTESGKIQKTRLDIKKGELYD